MGSLDCLCQKAISMKLMTYPEKAAIFASGDKFVCCSCFLEHFALKVEVSPNVLFQFMDMLVELRTCDGLIQEISKL